jgi:subtilisin family serine protease
VAAQTIEMYLDQYSGRGVRVAVVDSGVHAAHPHVGGISGGIAVREDGSLDDDFVDRAGHGTAVAAAIREKAPHAEIFAVKLFWRDLSTDVGSLVRAIDVASSQGAPLINLSLGTSESRHRDALRAVVDLAQSRGAIIVSAAESDGVEWLPGCLPGVLPVVLDWTCDRFAYRVVEHRGRPTIAASGYPRDIPGVPRERNLKGLSFAVANATGFAARALEAAPGARLATLLDTLISCTQQKTARL